MSVEEIFRPEVFFFGENFVTISECLTDWTLNMKRRRLKTLCEEWFDISENAVKTFEGCGQNWIALSEIKREASFFNCESRLVSSYHSFTISNRSLARLRESSRKRTLLETFRSRFISWTRQALSMKIEFLWIENKQKTTTKTFQGKKRVRIALSMFPHSN